MTTSALREGRVDRRVVDLEGRRHAGAARDERHREVVGEVLVDDRRLPGHRLFEVDDGRQRVVGDDDGVSRVARDVAIGGDDDGNGFAAVANGVHGDRAMVRRRKRRADRHRRQEFGDLGAGEHRFDAFHRLGGAGIDRADASVRDVASLERQMLHADEGDVVDVGAAASNQARILAPLDACANELRQNG